MKVRMFLPEGQSGVCNAIGTRIWLDDIEVTTGCCAFSLTGGVEDKVVLNLTVYPTEVEIEGHGTLELTYVDMNSREVILEKHGSQIEHQSPSSQVADTAAVAAENGGSGE